MRQTEFYTQNQHILSKNEQFYATIDQLFGIKVTKNL